ncbi:hypothetical protein H0B56_17060 [Haloechinothrix sp. YIM 98757]|uniref:IrrE N-terminal-like domain-containing protein n=1 Tax=Haloechinothrix aidingensis TaxID=2752311 RepID=A0A838ADA1_9PSEU|nr:hypothetical protein [Haloechinothrix aidingensis]MBA0127262.1 hypothetical protein [Haloechinothrix aidingensis]
MRERQLRRRCRRLLRALDIQPPLDVEQLCERIGRVRHRPIRLVPHPIPVPGPFGVWVATGERDYILYQQETSAPHQNHIVLHEFGHILAGHRSDETDDALLSQLYPGTDPGTLRQHYPELTPDAIRRALRRTAYDSEQEREAELAATIILEWASVLDQVALRGGADAATRRLGSALQDRLGWL